MNELAAHGLLVAVLAYRIAQEFLHKKSSTVLWLRNRSHSTADFTFCINIDELRGKT